MLIRLLHALLLTLALVAAGFGSGAAETHCGAPESAVHAPDGAPATGLHCCATAAIPLARPRLPFPRIARVGWPQLVGDAGHGREVPPETGVPRRIP
jgi:hypothetical protein